MGFDMGAWFAHSELSANRFVRWQRDDNPGPVSHSANMIHDDHSFGANLKAARLRKGWSQERLAAEAETSKGYVSDLERGKRPIPPGRKLESLAAALQLQPGDLLTAERRPLVAPIISWVAAGSLIDPETQIPAESETIEISGLPPGDYFATRVNGDSMDRFSPHGSLIIVNRAEREPIKGRRYIFSRRGETTYKRFDTEPLRLVPESTNPAHDPIFPRTDEEWTIIGRVRITLFDDL
ncbi:XRE family transcriptional regulator [Phenylobacterium sp.]|uniref:helix-turn-helix domain-containing protein n=1 Tax=Phenylobacterium sp. TaxID=1871053 RepID=UPI002731371A|nr:XRE family transcriptional regulator [Phenylobacterium sp.]